MISPASIQEVMGRADIIDVIGQFVRLRKRGANYMANCPFHNEKTPSFTVSPSKEIYKCFGCGRSGNSISFLMEAEKYSACHGYPFFKISSIFTTTATWSAFGSFNSANAAFRSAEAAG